MANGVFTTQPFNLGNTLTQVAQIQSLQSSNKLREAQLAEANRQTQVRDQLNTLFQQPGFDISDPATLNQLASLGPEGLGLAGEVTDLRTGIANLDITQRKNVISKAQFLNRKSRSINESEDIKQRFAFEMQDEEFAEIVNRIRPGLNLDDISDEELRQAVQQVTTDTDFANDPVAVTELLSGRAATELGFAPGSVVERTTGPLGDQKLKVLQKSAGAGTSLTFNPETGEFEFRQGGTGELTKPVTNKLQQSILDSDTQLARLGEIGKTFDPSFQTVAGRFEAGKTSIKEKLGFSVSSEEVDQLDRFATFKRNSIEALNSYIKLITGAQMSEAEADRLRQGFPDPGEGLFDGDSPTQYRAKYNATLKQLTLARSRAAWALTNGLIAPDVGTKKAGTALEKITTLEAFEGTINARADLLTNQFIEQQGMNVETARQQALIIVKQEFQL